MNPSLENHFEKMGARARISTTGPRAGADHRNSRRFARQSDLVRVNIVRDGKGEFFDINHRWDVDVEALDVRRRDRHLLLMARAAKDFMCSFLCGHDERAWFAAAVPESASAANVQDAMNALKPPAVWDSIKAHNLPAHHLNRRWTKAFVRQGEWFFIPQPDLDVAKAEILRDEPIRRGRGKPHICQLLCRFGGEEVFVCFRHPNGLTADEFRELDEVERNRNRWTSMVRDARVFARGAIRHSDHQTIWLSDWHEVVMNTETQSRAMQNLAFLD